MTLFILLEHSPLHSGGFTGTYDEASIRRSIYSRGVGNIFFPISYAKNNTQRNF